MIVFCILVEDTYGLHLYEDVFREGRQGPRGVIVFWWRIMSLIWNIVSSERRVKTYIMRPFKSSIHFFACIISIVFGFVLGGGSLVVTNRNIEVIQQYLTKIRS
jgi:hypothetical protein